MSAKLRFSFLGVGRTTTNWRVAGRLAVLRWRNVTLCIVACLLLAPAIGADAAGQNEGAPGAPTRARAGAYGQRTIYFAWNRPKETGTSPIIGYRIEVSSDAGSTWTDLVTNTDTIALHYEHMGLPVGATRHYRVSAINGSGPGPHSNVAHATLVGVASPPRNLAATVDGETVTLSWEPPADPGTSAVTGYSISQSRNGYKYGELVRNTGTTETTYEFEGDAGTTTYYRVRAVNDAGASRHSNVARAVIERTPGTASAPRNFAVTSLGLTGFNAIIRLSWEPPADIGSGPITGYEIERDPSGVGYTEPSITVGADATSHTFRGQQPNVTRYYRVRAVNSAGIGAFTRMLAVTTPQVGTPTAPTGLSATADGESKIDLAWTRPRDPGSGAITGYRIEVWSEAMFRWLDLVDHTVSTSAAYTHTGLEPGTTRRYRVSAINRNGPGPASNIAHATTSMVRPGLPGAPGNLVAAADGSTVIDLSWNAPADTGTSAVTGYQVEVSSDAGSSWTDLEENTGTTDTKYRHTGLAPSTTRHYRVSAINEIGDSPPSNVASAITDAVVPPDRPTGLVATAAATLIDLAWTAPEYDGGAPVTSYRVEVSEDGTEWSDLERSTGVTLTTYTHTGLQPGITRHYRVSAINLAGTGLPSDVASATTDDPAGRARRVNEAVLPHFAAAMTTSTLSAVSGRIEAVAAGNAAPSGPGAAGLASLLHGAERTGQGHDPAMARLLDGASFALPLGGAQAGQAGAGSTFGIWGGAEYHSMGEPDGQEVQWDGDMLSVHGGVDLRVHRNLLAGVAGTRSSGNYDFTDVTGAREIDGTYEAGMTTVNPYLAWVADGTGVTVWALGSFGWGEVAVDDVLAGRRASDARSKAGAAGGSLILLSNGPSALRLRGEGWLAQVGVDGAEGMDSLTLEMQRARFSLEWSQVHRFQGGSEAGVLLEAGMRYDRGDALDGAGMELGGGLRYASPSSAVTVEGRWRLLATGSSGYEEWGAGGMIRIAPQGGSEGLSLRLAPEWGQAASGVQELWERGVGGRPGGMYPMQKGRVNAELEYGLPASRGTPYGRVQVADGATRAYGTGMRYEITRVFDLRIEGTRIEGLGGSAGHGFAMRGRWEF